MNPPPPWWVPVAGSQDLRAATPLAARAFGVAEPAAPRTAPHGPDPLAADGGRPALPPRRVLSGPFDVATSAPRVVENFLDTAHFGFVHEGFLGSRDCAADRLSVAYRRWLLALGVTCGTTDGTTDGAPLGNTCGSTSATS